MSHELNGKGSPDSNRFPFLFNRESSPWDISVIQTGRRVIPNCSSFRFKWTTLVVERCPFPFLIKLIYIILHVSCGQSSTVNNMNWARHTYIVWSLTHSLSTDPARSVRRRDGRSVMASMRSVAWPLYGKIFNLRWIASWKSISQMSIWQSRRQINCEFQFTLSNIRLIPEESIITE